MVLRLFFFCSLINVSESTRGAVCGRGDPHCVFKRMASQHVHVGLGMCSHLIDSFRQAFKYGIFLKSSARGI